jgi:hypothetical protein
MAETEANAAAAPAPAPGRLRNAFGGVLCAFTLIFIGVLAFSIRIFSVRSDPQPVPPDPARSSDGAFPELCFFLRVSSFRVPQVIKYESVIHEFDPYFNFRVTQVRFDRFHFFWFCSEACGIGFSTHRVLQCFVVTCKSECWCWRVLGFGNWLLSGRFCLLYIDD